MSENDHAYELRELMETLTKAYEIVGETVRESLAGLKLTGQPEPADEPDRFEHTDRDGDWGRIAPGPDPSELYVNMKSLYLDQDAVNRLAQYLDLHRTDTADVDARPIKGECPACGHASHGSVGCGETARNHRCLCRGGSDGA